MSNDSLGNSLIVGTSNRGKLAELTELFAPCDLELVPLSQFQNVPDVEETGATIAENAALKATAYARHFNQWVLADDTSLAVDVLKGAPGVHTARYAGPNATGEQNRARLLADLERVPLEKRGAHFSCCLVLADPTSAIRASAEGRCAGRICLAPRGGGGFGYDPLFEFVEYRRTFAEMGRAAKLILGHRGRAAELMIQQICRLRDYSKP
jgi:XTP/dITP diphosphohydrolase